VRKQATWGELYKNKEDIDWCTENFGWFEDRIKCISYVPYTPFRVAPGPCLYCRLARVLIVSSGLD
jgi:hypothetical protein